LAGWGATGLGDFLSGHGTPFLAILLDMKGVEITKEGPQRVSKTLLRFAGLTLLGVFLTAAPVNGQQSTSDPTPSVGQQSAVLSPRESTAENPASRFSSVSLMRLSDYGRPLPVDRTFAKPSPSAPGRIEKMEAAFSCNDTPFIDQVRLPVAAMWRGRLRLTGFESDVTTANFVLGLPGAGTLHSLSLMGSGHLATHTPPSDQLVGMHLTLDLSGAETESVDNSGLHGMQYLVRSGRGFLQTLLAR
jgi:hypothetical protein